MKLNVLDRLILLNILPKEGNITTLRVLRDLTGRLSFSEEELALLQFKIDAGPPERTEWKQDVVGEVEILLGPKAENLIVEAFEKLDKNKQMRMEFLSVYEKFQEKEEEEVDHAAL